MASTSAAASRDNGVPGRLRNAASTLYSDNQSLIAVTPQALAPSHLLVFLVMCESD